MSSNLVLVAGMGKCKEGISSVGMELHVFSLGAGGGASAGMGMCKVQ